MRIIQGFEVKIRGSVAGAPGVRLIMTWDSDDPLAVKLTFPQGDNTKDWIFSRDLICAGLKRYTGDAYGDVHVWPDKDKVIISLRPRGERCDVECPKARVQAFYDSTVDHTAIGGEQARIDAAIENFIDDIRSRGA